jgi:hypothetical protein
MCLLATRYQHIYIYIYISLSRFVLAFLASARCCDPIWNALWSRASLLGSFSALSLLDSFFSLVVRRLA